MDAIIERILSLEFEMFQNIQNIDGRAPCQDDAETFKLLRGAQFSVWNEEMLSSYLSDLLYASLNERNLLWEKYARMMRFTEPALYDKLSGALPELDGETLSAIEEIVAAQVAWMKALGGKYPRLCAGGRPISSQQDALGDVSYETYLSGELASYSKETVMIYLNHVRALLRNRENWCYQQLCAIAKAYGYPSAEAAEESLAAKARQRPRFSFGRFALPIAVSSD